MARKTSATASSPTKTLSVVDGAAFLIGVVIGIGIFKTPSLVAANVGSEAAFIGVWLLGGAITLVGALCYAELGSAHPNAGGEYHYLSRAYGRPVGLLFAWARGTIIQTGAIAAVAFVYGDYASVLIPLGSYSSSIHAASAIAALTFVNLMGTPQGRRTQLILTALTLLAILAVVVAGLMSSSAIQPAASGPSSSSGAVGLAMVFVLLTYGGWNEAAYLSGELKNVRTNMVRTLLIGTGAVVVVYVIVNLVYLRVFGLTGLRATNAVGADLMQIVAGPTGATIIAFVICCTALSTLNATIFTGARVYYALGRDLAAIRILGVWDAQGHNPANAFLLQGGIALTLVAFGALMRDGFEAMVAYTAPVFWFFLLLIAISIFVFRRRDGIANLPYRLPLYPLPPILFGTACVWMIYSSLAYAGIGAMLGVAVLLAGTPLLLLGRASHTDRAK